MLGKWLRWFAVLVALGAGLLVWACTRDLARARERVAGRSSLLASPWGEIEYTQGGAGLPVLVIHGSGGGFDQGELVAEAVLGKGFRWITPSRFGYLRSTFHPGATFDEQAHAYAHLLDHLGVERVAVIALSHGGPSALLFAVLHPERVSSLTLLSAGVASSSAAVQAEANAKGARLAAIFQHDALYWAISQGFRGTLPGLMGADEAVIAGLSAEQRALADRVIDFMNPVSLRSAGAAFDNQAAMPNERIAAIRAPTLILHATDDRLQLFHNAEYAAATIPGAQLVRFERGGHLLLCVEQAAVRAEVAEHLRATGGAEP